MNASAHPLPRRGARSTPRRWLARGVLALCACLLLGHLLYAGAHHLHNRAWSGDQTFRSDFEDGSASIWRERGVLHLCCEDSLSIVDDPVRRGRHAAKFQLRRADPDVKGSKRAEVRMLAGDPRSEHWQRFSIQLPRNWVADPAPTTVAQWHGVPDKLLLESGRTPPLRLVVLEGEWVLVGVWDANRVTRSPFIRRKPDGWVKHRIGRAETGVWTDWVFHIRWSAGDDGLVEVWKNGELVFSRSGPNSYRDALAPYLKLGVYVPEWSIPQTTSRVHERVVYFDEVAVTDEPATFESFSAVR